MLHLYRRKKTKNCARCKKREGKMIVGKDLSWEMYQALQLKDNQTMLIFQRKLYPMNFLKFDYENETAFRGPDGRCIQAKPGKFSMSQNCMLY
jgi:hypothetical protein